MKRFEKKGSPAVGTRTGPRARAAQERKFADPYVRAERPSHFVPRDQGPRNAVVTLDPDVARVFRNSETVNEVLRLVMRLSRFGAGGGFNRDRPRPPDARFAGDRPRERVQFQRGKPAGPPFKRERKFEDK
jgi:hypothetical protein